MRKKCTSAIKGKAYTISEAYYGYLDGLVARGKYDWVHPRLTSRTFDYSYIVYFSPSYPRKILKAKLVTLTENIAHNRRSLDSNLKLIAPGYHPGSMLHLLAFGARYPNVQLEFPIIVTWPVCGFCYRGDVFDYFLEYYIQLTSHYFLGRRIFDVIPYNDPRLFSKESGYHFLVVENEKD